jgi:hypothetical protein
MSVLHALEKLVLVNAKLATAVLVETLTDLLTDEASSVRAGTLSILKRWCGLTIQ